MQDSKAPGLAHAVIQDGEIVLLKGYGVRDTKTHAPRNHCLAPGATGLATLDKSEPAYVNLRDPPIADSGPAD